MSTLREECGVFGIFSTEPADVAADAYYALFALQHRGQETSGIVVNDDGVFRMHRDCGLVNDVFTPSVMEKLGQGNMAVGHVLYGTDKGSGRENAQPIVVNHIKGHMALATNGNIINAFELRSQLEMTGSIFHTSSDAEIISCMIIRERIAAASIEEAVERAIGKLEGAYSMVVMSPSKMIAVRDPHGFRPLCYGQKKDGSYIVVSESCALDAVGAKFIRDVEPGEMVVFTKDGVKSIKTYCGKEKMSMCVFEYIYFARPDSKLDGCLVHDSRVMAGRYLAKEHPVEADVVIGVPDSGLDAAIGYSRESGIPYGVGFLKNKYIGRTFIAPGQSAREDRVRIKLNPIAGVVAGKRVVMIDDSIVRGTTCARIIKLLREAGATEVHVRVSAPPFINPCYYGTDIDSKDKLIACRYNIDEIAGVIGADSLGFLELEHAKCITGEHNCDRYCTACFDSIYPTEVPKTIKANKFDRKISDNTSNPKGE